jgi:hypothetical protein
MGLQSRGKVLQQVIEAIKSTMYVYTQQKTTEVHQGCDPQCLMPTIPAVGPPTRAHDEDYDTGQMRDHFGAVVSILDSHRRDPGSIPCNVTFCPNLEIVTHK